MVLNQEQKISLCIPRLGREIQKSDIYKVFQVVNFGEIDRIDLVEVTTFPNDIYKRAFIHFKNWYSKDLLINHRLSNGLDIKIVYDFPFFWKISVNKSLNNNYNINKRKD